jgi:acyl-CoA reductase-like NAD-dependent aldehyde dehydrogenase
VWTTVAKDPDNRMHHWQLADRWMCVEGSAGHRPPEPLRPLPAELVVHKSGFSPFVEPELDRRLRELGVDTLLLVGVHVHGCIRATALDAYQRGFAIWVVDDCVASDDALHAQVTRSYLAARAVRFLAAEQALELLSAPPPRAATAAPLPAATIAGAECRIETDRLLIRESPRQRGTHLWTVPIAGGDLVRRAVASAREAQSRWSHLPLAERLDTVRQLPALLAAEHESLAMQIAVDIGKPIADSREEVRFAIGLLEAAIGRIAGHLDQREKAWWSRGLPVGAVAQITPFNNPLAIPVGKIAPALLFGNAVVWKPAPAGTAIALRLAALMADAGWPPGLVNVVCGDESTAELLMSDPEIGAVSLTGSDRAGLCARVACARRGVPLQAELGGNNAAIVWSDAAVEDAAAQIAAAAFGSAGQRCTANRRAVVEDSIHGRFLSALEGATAALRWGDPLDADVRVGPLVSESSRVRVEDEVAGAADSGCTLLAPLAGGELARTLLSSGAYFPPTVVCCDEPSQAIVQQETFGPVLVVQRAADWDEAVSLCNGVPHGLVASLFSSSHGRQRQFLEGARAGVLKLNRATAGVDADAPFGGWARSGVGPPEHGLGDEVFYTRRQTVYAEPGAAHPSDPG